MAENSQWSDLVSSEVCYILYSRKIITDTKEQVKIRHMQF
jgi:hypothetical protein